MGRVFGEFAVGQRFVTPGRTITEADVVAFSALTGDHNPVHADEAFAAATPFGARVAHGPMGIGIAFGLASRLDLIDGTVVALLGITWDFRAPMRPGDTIRVVIEVVETRAVRQPDLGLVGLALTIVGGGAGWGEEGTVLQEGIARLLMRRERPPAAAWGAIAPAPGRPG